MASIYYKEFCPPCKGGQSKKVTKMTKIKEPFKFLEKTQGAGSFRRGAGRAPPF
ncbi:MAG: hypothetical protein HFG04_03890 [Oscillibacter sp.]|nr:hypothetical protein [Oscillibacter sp.]MCI9002367.1 hypothetical protein [Oscillibacter sp.]